MLLKSLYTLNNLHALTIKGYGLNYTTNAMTFHSVLSIYLSSVATSLQHVRMEFSYHNSCVMPELAVCAQTFCIDLDVLQLGYCKSVVLLHDWSYH